MSKVIKQCFIIILSSLMLSSYAGLASAKVAEVTIEAIGFGESRDEAVNEAIESAMGKAFGIRFEATIESHIASRDFSVDGKSKYQFTDKFVKSVKTAVNTPVDNPVLGYEVVDELVNDNEWQVKIALTYAKFIPLNAQNNRRSMIVISIDSNTEELRDRIEHKLVNSRRFNILSRDLEDAFVKEVEFLNSGNVKVQELARLAQAKGADYILAISAKKEYVIASHYNSMLGKYINKHQFVYKVNARVVDFSSREMKWSIHTDVDILARSKSELTSKIDAELSIAANDIVTSMTEAIYPARLSTISENGNRAILNRGTGSIEEGQVVTIFKIGDKIIDPQSGESLGYDEIIVGEGLIVDVKPKYSVIQVIGNTLKANDEHIVRWSNKKEIINTQVNDFDKVNKTKQNTQVFLQQ